jgi:hypothetical protein
MQGLGPFIDALHLMLNAPELAPITAALLQADVVFSIGPIDADIGGKCLRVWRLHVGSPKE